MDRRRRLAAAVTGALAIAGAGCGSFIDNQAATSTLKILRASQEAGARLPDVQLAREAMPGGIVQLAAFARAYPRHREFRALYAEAVCQYPVAFLFDDWEDAQLGGRADEAARVAARLPALLGVCVDANLEVLPPAWREAYARGGDALIALAAGARREHVPALRWIATADAVRVALDPVRQVGRLGAVLALLERCVALAPGEHGADAEILLGTLRAERRRIAGSGDDGAALFAAARAALGEGALLVAVMEARAVAVARGDRAGFEAAIRRVLDADAARWPERRLANELARVKARRYLAAADALFAPRGAGSPAP